VTLVFEEGMGYKYFYGKVREEWKMVCYRHLGAGIFLIPERLSIPRPKIA